MKAKAQLMLDRFASGEKMFGAVDFDLVLAEMKKLKENKEDKEKNFTNTSLQKPAEKLSAEYKLLLEKYPITKDKLEQIKFVQEKIINRDIKNKMSLESVIRANIISSPEIYGKEISQRIWDEEQAKKQAAKNKSIVTKTAVQKPKNNPKKKPYSGK
jgi:hypothetical protein